LKSQKQNTKINPLLMLNQCVFIRGFQATRRFFRIVPMRATAEPLPDDPDNSQEDEIQVIQVPDAPEVGNPCCETEREA
jgi:hypothetical protein